MGTLNDFKLVKQISTKYFSKLNVEPKNEVNDTDKSRLGFYLFILSCVTDATDIEDVVSRIIDTDFQRKMYGKTNNDLGIDAVYIDEENHDIKLFNFKYREKFNEDKRQALNTVSDSSKFLNAVSTHTTDGLDELTKNAVQEIIDGYNSNDIWNTQL